MVKVVYPPYNYKIKQEGDRSFIFDEVRKQWLVLTPEEWVRQNTLQYMVQTLHYPLSLIALEKEIKLGDLKKRFDMLVYNKQHQPWMMVECKAAEVAITEAVLQQVLRYNITIPVPYLCLTNGNEVYVFGKQNGELVAMDHFPALPF